MPTVLELKDRLRKKGLPVSGNKADLEARLAKGAKAKRASPAKAKASNSAKAKRASPAKAKRVSCGVQSTAHYANRPSPARPAQACPGKTFLGNDGNQWKSVGVTRMGVVVYRWMRVK